MRAWLPPSPFRSVWTSLVYCLTLYAPVGKLLSLLGDWDLVATHADSIQSFLQNPWGMWVPVVVGFLLLGYINHKDRQKGTAEDGPRTEPENQPTALPPTLEEWTKNTPLTLVADKTFRNRQVPLDGFSYTNCTFDNVTFVYKGEKPFALANVRFEGANRVHGASPPLEMLMTLQSKLGILIPDAEVGKEGES